MAKTTEPSKAKRRKFKTAPTLREQTQQQQKPAKTSVVKQVLSKILWPLRAIGTLIKKVTTTLANSKLGAGAKRLYQSRVFAPVRFLVRILSKILLISYFKNSWQELKLVTWPNAKLTWRLTFAVLMFGLAFGLIIAGLDYVLEKGFREVLLG